MLSFDAETSTDVDDSTIFQMQRYSVQLSSSAVQHESNDADSNSTARF